jgi:hypothetical protein
MNTKQWVVGTVAGGMKAGATVGFLIWMVADFTLYGITNINNLTVTIVDPLVELVHGGIAGPLRVESISQMPGEKTQKVIETWVKK